jgi:hypothetical protein
MGPQYGSYTGLATGSDELDGPIHAIGIGAGQRLKSTLGGCLGECLGAGNAEPQREVRMNVEVGVHKA